MQLLTQLHSQRTPNLLHVALMFTAGNAPEGKLAHNQITPKRKVGAWVPGCNPVHQCQG
jgi:hypothetical protein